MNPINPYNFNNTEVPIAELSHLNLSNLQEREKDSEKNDNLLSVWTTSRLYKTVFWDQQTLLHITKIFVQTPSLPDETLREINHVVGVLHRRMEMLISELKRRNALYTRSS